MHSWLTLKKTHKEKLQSLYDTETVKYNLQDECIERVINCNHILSKNPEHVKTNDKKNLDLNLIQNNRKSFLDLIPLLDESHFGKNKTKYKPTVIQLKAFIQLREQVSTFKKNKPVYKSLKNKTKDELIEMCTVYKNKQLQP